MQLIEHHFQSLASTNDWLKAHLPTFSKDAFVVVSADQQTAGRGQYGRHWLSPHGQNVYVSFGFFIAEDVDMSLLTRLLALSAATVLQNYTVTCTLKWPNDLLVKGKKIAGILCETENISSYTAVVIGIGLNVNMPEEHLALVGQPATSLSLETRQHIEPQTVLAILKDRFFTDLKLFLNKGFTPFLPLFQSLIKV